MFAGLKFCVIKGCNMSYRMKVTDVFKVAGKTIFSGQLEPIDIEKTSGNCRVEVNGVEVCSIEIEGEVQTGQKHRDLWTKSNVNISKDEILLEDVWLISK